MASTDVRCANCGAVLDEASDLRADERQPCDRCGSRARRFETRGTLTLATAASASAEVERGVNDIRLAVLGILVTIGLTVGFGVDARAWVRVASGLGAFALAAFLIWWRPARKRLMAFMHRLTGH